MININAGGKYTGGNNTNINYSIINKIAEGNTDINYTIININTGAKNNIKYSIIDNIAGGRLKSTIV